MGSLPLSPKWLIPLILAILGIVLFQYAPTNFLGILSFALAALILCFFAIGLLPQEKAFLASCLGKILWTLVVFVVICCIITGSFVAKGHPSPATTPCDYILVLGCSVEGDRPGPILQNRIDRAWEYLTENPQTVAILTGGMGDDENISEAECMRRELMARGIDADRLWIEDQSASTQENFQFSVAKIQEKTGKAPEKLGVLSSETHLFRASLYAESVGVESVGIPAKTTNIVYYVNYFLREIPCIWKIILLGG